MNQRIPRIHYLMFVIAAAAVFFAGTCSVARVDYLMHSTTIAEVPARLNSSGLVTSVTPAAARAGFQQGDQILTVDDQTVHGYSGYFGVIASHRAGDQVTFQVRHPDGSEPALQLTLQPQSQKPATTASWVLTLFLLVVFPNFCVLLGVWVVIARPREPNAWYLLGILNFIQFFLGRPEHFGGPIFDFMVLWTILGGPYTFIGLMLFGIYFPERLVLDRRFPWFKWLILTPILLSIPYDLMHDWWCYLHDFSLGARFLPSLYNPLQIAENVLAGVCIAVFFAALGYKYGKASTRDAKRRLAILFVGAQVGIAPLTALVITSVLRHRSFDEAVPRWLELTFLGLFTLFPLSLAYVVVVERAMEIRILLRQGTQYAFARGTITAIRVILGTMIAFSLTYGFKHEWRAVDQIRIFVVIGLFFAFRFRLAQRLSASIDRRFFREAYSTEQVLAELSDQARNFTETRPLLETIVRRLGETLHIDHIAVLLRNGNSFLLQQAAGINGGAPIQFHVTSSTIRHLDRENRPATVYHDDPDGWLLLASETERDLLRNLDSEVLLPLPGRKSLIGVISLGPKRSEEPYSRTDFQLLQSVALQTGLAIENSQLLATLTREATQRERINREIEIAHEVQERLFPQVYPTIPGCECAGYCRPAQGVGGDYYDFMTIDRDRGTPHLGFAIGDVSGKGISAALLMASLRASLRGMTLAGPTELATLMYNVNTLVYEASASNRYATFFYGEYDPSAHALTYVNAGHNAPIILRPRPETPGAACPPPASGTAGETKQREYEVLRLEAGGPVVGLIAGAAYTQGNVPLMPGDIVITFTDGISEAMNHQDDEWGEERMIAAALTCTHCTARDMLNRLIELADAFTEGAPQHDDMTLAILKIT